MALGVSDKGQREDGQGVAVAEDVTWSKALDFRRGGEAYNTWDASFPLQFAGNSSLTD